MSEFEYEEENLDEFMIKSSQILITEDNTEEKEIIIESLKQHLSSIFDNPLEIKNFYKTLNMVIFSEKTNKIRNRQCFKIFPIVFSFNPKSCFDYIDFYLFAINQSIKEENRPDFSFLCVIFSEIITILFHEENANKYLISIEYLLEESKKYKLYEKLYSFLKDKIISEEKLSQSFGCLFLTELIEKCPIIKEEKYLEEIFKLLSKKLEDKNFQCKLDILNCLISLIFVTEQKFMSYANICLFRVLDYLTHEQWIMRKLAINIVYTLIFFCKEEIIPVKANIIEFLNVLKEDPVDEIKEVCLQTLKLLEDGENSKINHKSTCNNIINIDKNHENGIIDIKKEKKNDGSNGINNDDIQEKNDKSEDKEVDKEKKVNKFINRHIHFNNTDKKNKEKINKIKNKKENNKQNKSYKNIIGNRNKKFNPMSKLNIIFFNNKNQSSRTPMRNKNKKESKYNNSIKTEIITDKNQEDKSQILNSPCNAETKNNSGNKKEKIPQDSNHKNKILNEKIQDEIKAEKQKNITSNTNENNINNIKGNSSEKEEEYFQKILADIMGQLEKMQEGQAHFLNMVNNLQTKLNDNYNNLNKRITTLENSYFNENNCTIKSTYMNHNSNKSNNKRKRKISNVNELKIKFRLGKYNEVLREAITNENILFKILPLIDKNNIGKINNEILDDVINILNKKIILINLENGRTILSGILSFYMSLVKAKIPLKLISQLNIKDSLVMFQNKNSDRLLQIDINNIDAIVKNLKV